MMTRGYIPQARQQTLEVSRGGFPGTTILNRNIEDDTILIHSMPQIMLNALDADEYLAEVPLVARPGTAPAQITGEAVAEFLAPAPQRPAGDDYTALRRKQLNRLTEHVIQPYTIEPRPP
jgi:hypothetical protein